MPAPRKHDAGFFTVELPPDWVASELGAGTLLLHDPRGEVTLTLIASTRPASPASHSGHDRPVQRGEAQYELKKWLDSQKHIAVRQPPREIPGARLAFATTEGLQRSPKHRPWYQRLLRRSPALLWRFWAIVNPHILILASCSGQSHAVEKLRTTLDRILGSLQLAQRDILLGRPFTEKVASLARSYFPELAVAIIDDAHLRCGSQPVSLTPLHRRYLAAPEDLPAQVKTFFAQVRGDLPEPDVADSWISARRHLFPALVPTSAAQLAGRLHEPWINALSIAYDLENEGHDRPVSAADGKRWNVDPEILHEHSLRNLILQSREHTMEMQKFEGCTMLLLAAPEKHNAARLLLPQLCQVLREQLGSNFYAAIPSPEFLLAFSTANAEVLDRVRRQIAADCSRAKNPLSPRIFVVTPDGIAGDPNEPEDMEL